MKPTQLREMNVEQLTRRNLELREELFKLILQKQTAQLEKPSRLKDLRRDIARVHTVLSERRLSVAVKPEGVQS
jgi:large subunit ribosomal protein L29